MVVRTIRCRLTASRETRQFFWEKMVAYTCLINQLFSKVAQDEQFNDWQQSSSVPRKPLEEIIKTIEKESGSYHLPARFYTSAVLMTQYVYKSWFALQKRRQWQIQGKRRWLEIMKQDSLLAHTDFSPETIYAKAREILSQTSNNRNEPKKKRSEGKKSLLGSLMTKFEETDDLLTKCAVLHLLKNDFEVSEETHDDPDDFKLRLESKRIEIERLEEQLQSRLPKGRDPTGDRFAENLIEAIALPDDTVSNYSDLVFSSWLEQKQIKLLNPLPYPIIWGSADDLRWTSEPRKLPPNAPRASSNTKKKKKPAKKKQITSEDIIGVRFKGLSAHTFKVQCDRRQLPIFRQFFTDYKAYNALPEEERFSQKIFALCSAQLIWCQDSSKSKQKKPKDNPSKESWDSHRLYLHCTIDTQYLTAEGTADAIRLAKQKILKELGERATIPPEEIDSLDLTQPQKSHIKRKRTTLKRLDNPSPIRPRREEYQGNPLITVGISLSRQMPLTACVVDIRTSKVLECQATKRLLLIKKFKIKSKKHNAHQLKRAHWRLVNKLNLRKKRNSVQRQSKQKQDAYRESESESNLGAYTERLLANRVVALAMAWEAGSIVVPDLKNIREVAESDIKARAQERFPHEKQLQKQYCKDLRASYHRWSYSRLVGYISDRAALFGISVMTGKQPTHMSLPDSALHVAMSGHQLSAV